MLLLQDEGGEKTEEEFPKMLLDDNEMQDVKGAGSKKATEDTSSTLLNKNGASMSSADDNMCAETGKGLSFLRTFRNGKKH